MPRSAKRHRCDSNVVRELQDILSPAELEVDLQGCPAILGSGSSGIVIKVKDSSHFWAMKVSDDENEVRIARLITAIPRGHIPDDASTVLTPTRRLVGSEFCMIPVEFLPGSHIDYTVRKWWMAMTKSKACGQLRYLQMPIMTPLSGVEGYLKRMPMLDYLYEVVCPLTAAFEWLAGHNIVHLDVKPDNILYDRETRHAMVCDFGMAASPRRDQCIRDFIRTSEFNTLYTTTFRPPEVRHCDYDQSSFGDIQYLEHCPHVSRGCACADLKIGPISDVWALALSMLVIRSDYQLQTKTAPITDADGRMLTQGVGTQDSDTVGFIELIGHGYTSVDDRWTASQLSHMAESLVASREPRRIEIV